MDKQRGQRLTSPQTEKIVFSKANSRYGDSDCINTCTEMRASKSFIDH